MAHVAFDPRKTIRSTIGTNRYNFKRRETYYTINVSGTDYRDIYVPIYLYENINTNNLPTMPFISLKLASVINEPHNVKATVRKFIAYVDVDISYVNTENIDVVDFLKDMRDELHNLIRTNQEVTTGIYFMNLDDERYMEEVTARQVVFHYILTLRCEYHDAC